MNDGRGRGNGVLYVLLLGGVAMVLGGIAIERMPDLDSLIPDAPEPEPDYDPYYAEPEPEPAEPAPVSPAYPDLGLPPPAPPPARIRSAAWHAEVQSVEGLPRGTPCMLRVDMEHGLSGPVAR
jgi:hypothetical protein